MRSFWIVCLLPALALGARLAPIGPTGNPATTSPAGDLGAWHVGSLAAWRGPAAAWRNPALLAFNPRNAEMEGIFSAEDGDHAQAEDWGFFLRMGELGVGVVHHEDSTGAFSANQYRIGMATGGKQLRFGYSYDWSKGNWDAAKQPDQVRLGVLAQPSRWVSLAAVSTSALGRTGTNPAEVIEAAIALRPLTRRLTLSLDASWFFDRDYAYLEDSGTYWAGVEAEPFDWLRLAARQNLDTEDLVFQANLAWRGLSIGGLLPQAKDDALDPARRIHLHTSTAEFNRFYPIKPKPKLFARINLAGIAGEFPWLMVGQKFRLMRFFEQLDAAEQDPRVKGLFINWEEGFTADPAMLYEIRERILDYKEKTGGEVAFYSHNLGMGSLYIASAADRRALLPIGQAQLGPFGGERLYFADLLEEVGVDFVRFNRGAWKGAGEELDRAGMSDEVRENVGRALGEIYTQMIDDMREGYGFDTAAMEAITARWFLTKQDLLDFGLVDTLVYPDKVEDWVCRRAGDEDDEDGEGGGVTISLGFNLGKLAEQAEGDQVVSLASLKRLDYEREWGRPDEIAVIYASGPIFGSRSIGPLSIGHETVVEQFRRARTDSRVKAVVFHIDSPGGSGYTSDLIWREMTRLAEKKPLIVTQGFLAASGGYYLSMAADTILTTPLTITGSIGVAAGVLVDRGLVASSRLRQDGVWAGKPESLGGAMLLADLRVPAGSASLRLPTLPVLGRPLSEVQSRELQGMIDDFYHDFVDKAAQGRGLSWDEVDAVAEGRIWAGQSARELKLVDEAGGLRQAIELARRELGPKGERARIREIHPEFNLMDILALLGGGLGELSLEQARIKLQAEKQAAIDDQRMQLLGSGRPELLIDEEPLRFELK
jgi:protease IV